MKFKITARHSPCPRKQLVVEADNFEDAIEGFIAAQYKAASSRRRANTREQLGKLLSQWESDEGPDLLDIEDIADGTPADVDAAGETIQPPATEPKRKSWREALKPKAAKPRRKYGRKKAGEIPEAKAPSQRQERVMGYDIPRGELPHSYFQGMADDGEPVPRGLDPLGLDD